MEEFKSQYNKHFLFSRQNEELYIPYSIKSKYCFSKGDFKNVIDCKHNVFKKSPFEYGEYEEYIRMLIYGIQLYIKAGDNKSASICFNELEYAKEKLADNKNKLSSLGKMIDDQPKTDLPEELVKDINEIEKLLKK